MASSIREGRPVVAIGAHDGMTARIAERSGFGAIYHGSYAVSSTYGVPDIGLIGLAENRESLRRVVSAVEIPVIADADTGYGEATAVSRTIKELEAAGATAVQLEDQVAPKRCGHMPGKEVLTLDEMLVKVDAALAARDDETMIVARTDSLQGQGLDEAIHRCNAFADVGADIVFIDALETVEQMQTAADEIGAPLVANMVDSGVTPRLSVEELSSIGFSIVIFPVAHVMLFARAYQRLCASIVETGSTAAMCDEMLGFAETNELLGLTPTEGTRKDP